jgi:hypothetical protein
MCSFFDRYNTGIEGIRKWHVWYICYLLNCWAVFDPCTVKSQQFAVSLNNTHDWIIVFTVFLGIHCGHLQVIKIKDNELDDCVSHEVFLICAKLIIWCTSFCLKLSRPKLILLSLSSIVTLKVKAVWLVKASASTHLTI